MSGVLKVVLDKPSGEWLVQDGEETLQKFARVQDARAFARATLLERDEGSVDVYTPSGRRRETLSLRKNNSGRFVQAA